MEEQGGIAHFPPNRKMKKSKKVMLGTSAAMALTVAGCSVDDFTAYSVDADYLKICRNVESNKRLPDDDCTNSTSQHASWYYMPLYEDNAIKVPKTNEEVSNGVSEVPKDKKVAEVGKDDENINDKKILASSGYGLKEEDEDIKADYAKVCVDQNGKRVDEDECHVDDNGEVHHNTNSSIVPMFLYLPMFNNTSTYIPPVGSQVNTKDAVKSLPNGKTSQNVSKNGVANAFTSKGGKTSNSGSKGGSNKGGGIPRGGFGKGGGSVGS